MSEPKVVAEFRALPEIEVPELLKKYKAVKVRETQFEGLTIPCIENFELELDDCKIGKLVIEGVSNAKISIKFGTIDQIVLRGIESSDVSMSCTMLHGGRIECGIKKAENVEYTWDGQRMVVYTNSDVMSTDARNGTGEDMIPIWPEPHKVPTDGEAKKYAVPPSALADLLVGRWDADYCTRLERL